MTGTDSDCMRALSFCLTAWGAQVDVVRRAVAVGQEVSGSQGGQLIYAECVIGGYRVWGAGRSDDIIAAASAAIGSSFGRIDEIIAAGGPQE